jgi:predicted acylesterase/phospholipase RssA
LADAVAASSAFPLLFQPFLINYEDKFKQKMTAVVTDGGVYDNIGNSPINNSKIEQLVLGLDPLLVANKYLNHPYYGRIEGVSPTNDLPHTVVFVSDAVSTFCFVIIK